MLPLKDQAYASPDAGSVVDRKFRYGKRKFGDPDEGVIPTRHYERMAKRSSGSSRSLLCRLCSDGFSGRI
jgi:hypothetical protein